MYISHKAVIDKGWFTLPHINLYMQLEWCQWQENINKAVHYFYNPCSANLLLPFYKSLFHTYTHKYAHAHASKNPSQYYFLKKYAHAGHLCDYVDNVYDLYWTALATLASLLLHQISPTPPHKKNPRINGSQDWRCRFHSCPFIIVTS